MRINKLKKYSKKDKYMMMHRKSSAK